MKNVLSNVATLAIILPLLVAGCATQGETKVAATATPVATAAPVASAAPAATATATAARVQPAIAAAHAVRPKVELPPPSANETLHGIQITQVGMAAAGGMVDLRFKILDAAKASKLLGNPANAPMLIAGDAPPLMPPHHALRGAKFGEGSVFFILYPNVRSAIKAGVEVTVAMGDVRLGPVMVH